MNISAQLRALCLTLHRLLYVNRDRDAARAYLSQLKALLEKTPKNTISIVAAEGRAIYHELRGNISQAIASRLREVDLMERLYEDIRKHDYDETTKNALLAGRDQAALSIRKAVIKSLRRKLKE